MNRLKKFLKNKAINNSFKNSGEGVRLSSGQPSSSSSPAAVPGAPADRDVSAQAALRRMQRNEPQDASKKRIQMLAKKQLEEEKAAREMEGLRISGQGSSSSSSSPQVQQDEELDHSGMLSQVFYTSELLGEHHVRSKKDLLEDIKNFLNDQIRDSEDECDKATAAVLMIYSLNNSQRKEPAIETICKICQNILQNPEEVKYKSIRLANKAYNERVASVVGGRAFLEAVGFTEKFEGGESFLVFTKESDTHLVEALEMLKDGQAVPIKVARNLELFTLKEGQKPTAPRLADDFYNLSAAEVKAEQKKKEMQVDRMLTLRTKEMREKDEKTSNSRYKYTLIRVRLPGNILIQGVFGCYEPFSAVRVFVASVLSDALATSEFTLRDALGQQADDESASLAQLSLAPAALLHLTLAESSTGYDGNIVADDYVELIRELD